MKTTDFITEGIAEDADEMHRDHEVQMARADCYNATKYAIDLHKMLHQVAESQGLDGWVSEKITLANDYLRTVHEYLAHKMAMGQEDTVIIPEFNFESADAKFNNLLNEVSDETLTSYLTKVDADSQKHEKDPTKRSPEKRSKSVTGFSRAFNKLDARKEKVNEIDPRNYDSDWDYRDALNRRSKQRDDDDFDIPDDDDFDPDELSNYEKYVNNLPEGKQKAVKESVSAGGTGAGSIASVVGGTMSKPGTGKPKKVGNTIKRVNPKFGKGIY